MPFNTRQDSKCLGWPSSDFSPLNRIETVNTAAPKYSSSYRIWLWISIIAMFMVVHLPKDKVNLLYEYAVHFITNKSATIENLIINKNIQSADLAYFVLRLKKIVFFISLMIIAYPVIGSLTRAGFLWDSQKFRRRLIYSGIIFLLLSLFEFPSHLRGAGAHYASMSLSPFEASTGWYYRRLLAPAIAHFLGFQGRFLFHLFSLTLNFVLIFFVIAFVEYDGIRPRLIDLLSITTTSFVMFNFHIQGFADPLMYVVLLIAVIAVDSLESRLAIVTLALVAHEASVFILIPLMVFYFPRKEAPKYLLVVMLYFVLYLLSFQLNAKDLIASHIVLDNKIGIDFIREYPIRGLGGFFFSYKLLWCIIIYGIWEMLRSNDNSRALSVFSIAILSPAVIIILCVDVSRHIGIGFLGLLISYNYLIKSGYGKTIVLKALMLVNILIPSVYVGSNAGFHTVPGLYEWLYGVYGLRSLLLNF